MLKVNSIFKKEFIVQADQTADLIGSGNLCVFSTPSLIAIMENTAFLAIEESLDEESTSVGVNISANHLKANIVGDQLTVISTLSNIDRKKLVFNIEVFHGDILVANGEHTRFIVNKNKFMNQFK